MTTANDAEMPKLLRVDLLIIDDFARHPLDALDTANVYDLVVERHRAAATIVTSNREPVEWLGDMVDPLSGQYAIDWLHSAAHELVLDPCPTGNARSQSSSTRTRSTPNHQPDQHQAANAEAPDKWSQATAD